MKYLKTIVCLLALCFAAQADAQIFKKLGNKIGKVAEKTIEKKVEEKTEKETEKAFDSTFNNQKKKPKKQKKTLLGISNASPNDAYKFSHIYTMQIDDGKRTTDIDYYLTNNGEYLGFKIPDDRQNMLTVIDVNKTTMFIFMDNKGDKTQMAMNADFVDITNDSIDENNYSITATGKTKTILGYLAKEYNVKSKDMHGIVWTTNQAGVSFSTLYTKSKSKKGLDQKWFKMIDGLPLEMNMTYTTKRKAKNIIMRCVSLEKTAFSINTSSYKKIM